MPEGAEVALTAEILNNFCKGKSIRQIYINSGRYTKKIPDNFNEFQNYLPLKIKKIDSKGKFLWFECIEKNNVSWFIWNTFGLTGAWSFTEDKFTRISLELNTEEKIYFTDLRNFGTLKFVNNKFEMKKKLRSLGPDFLKCDNLNLDKISKYNTPIVQLLMDQKKIGSGLGNYLVAEILYKAKISPHRLGVNMSDDDILHLTYWIKYIIKKAYLYNNTKYVSHIQNLLKNKSYKNYHPEIKIKEKKFNFSVYKKKKDPYGNDVIGEKIVGNGSNKRTTYWVPDVQI